MKRRPDEVRAWLAERPSLAEMREEFPEEWATVQRELSEVAAAEDPSAVRQYAAKVAAPPRLPAGRSGPDAVVAAEVRRHLAAAALRQAGLSAATGVTQGRLRFNLVNGYVAQKLLFKRDLERKPVSNAAFRLLWPLVWQKRFLMPLVEPKGIYCFYSRKLVRRLADRIGERPALEIAAGDGTLSRFLRDAGVDITATDDRSWGQIAFPDDVLPQEARHALRVHEPQVVVCSWPPAGNPFERWVFETESVELYVVISSRHEFASGDWTAYRQQQAFTFELDEGLSRLVLPPELDAAVYVFTRRPRQGPAGPSATTAR